MSVKNAVELANQLNAEAVFCSPVDLGRNQTISLLNEISGMTNPPKRTYLTTDPLQSFMVEMQKPIVDDIFTTARGSWPESAPPLTLVATLSPQLVQATVTAFGQSTFSLVDAIALDASFGGGKGKPPYMMTALGVDEYGGWKYPEAAQQDEPSILAMIKDLQLSAEVGLWEQISFIKGTEYVRDKTIIGWNGMPVMHALNGFRAAGKALSDCVSQGTFPCGLSGTGIVVESPGDVTVKFKQDLADNAAREQEMSDMLVNVSSSAEVGAMFTDHLRRWAAITTPSLIISGPMYTPLVGVINAAGPNLGGAALSNIPPWHSAGQQQDPRWAAFKNYATSKASPPTPPPPAATATCNTKCSSGTCYKDQCVCWAGFRGASCDQVDQQSNKQQSCSGSPGMGLNPSGLSDWSTGNFFWDYMKQGREWESSDFTSDFTRSDNSEKSEGGQVSVNAAGYPTGLRVNQKVGTMVISNVNMHGRSGWYVLTWEGDGIVDVGMGSVRMVKRIGPGRVEVLVELAPEGDDGVLISILRTNPNDLVRNMRFVPSWVEEEALYVPIQPHVISFYKEFSTLRFMDWGRASSNFGRDEEQDRLSLDWSHRTLPTDRTFTSKTGVPFETMIQVANIVGSSPWFCIPHLASDSFVSSLASLIHTTLRSDLTATIEYSNEAWGNIDGVEYGAPEAAGSVFSSQEAAKINASAYCYIVKRTKEYRDVMVTALTEAVVSQRFKFVLAARASDTETGKVMLGLAAASWMVPCTGTAADAYKWVDGLAIAPFAGGDLASKFAQNTGSKHDDGRWAAHAIKSGTRLSLEQAKNMSSAYKAIVDDANARRGSASSPIKYRAGSATGTPPSATSP